MQHQFELVSHHLCPYVQRSVIVLLEKGVEHKRTYIDLSNKPDWFLDVSPFGKVPVLLVKGKAVFESAVICEYLDEITPGSLHPADPLEKAIHRSWIEYGSATLSAIAGFYSATNKGAFLEKMNDLKSRLARLEEVFSSDGPFFTGETFHMIDAVYGTVFRYFDVVERIDDFGFFDELPTVTSWRRNIADRATVKHGAVEDYADRLMSFFENKSSELGRLAASRHF